MPIPAAARRLAPVLLLALACPAVPVLAQPSGAFPVRPLRMIIPNAPGGASDLITRMIGPRLTEAWGQPAIAENRPGATGVIAAEFVAKQPPDGHTLLVMSLTQLVGTLGHQKYVLSTDLAPVSLLGSTPFAVAVNMSVPVRTFPEWVAYAKANTGKLAYASAGAWGSNHLCMESLNEIIGTQMLHVPYPGSPQATTALITDQVQAMCAAGPTLATLWKQGKLRPLAITYLKPSRLMPDVPTVTPTLPGYEMLGWYGMQTTRGTPAETINRINAEVGKVLRTPEVVERMLALGAEAQGSTPAEFAAFLNREAERWGKLLRERNARLED